MAGTYSITETVTHPTKFACKVSFNGKAAEYYECDSLDSNEISACLQKTADNDAERVANLSAVEEAKTTIEIVDGKIITQ